MTNFQDWVENAVYPQAVDLIDMTEFEPFVLCITDQSHKSCC